MLSRHLVALEGFGWIMRNPGHGHPLRPEYLLSGTGAPIAAWCARVMRERARLGLEPEAIGRWSLPLVGQLQAGWQRFSELERALVPITPRALSLTVQQSIAHDLARRSADRRRYGLTPRGADLASILFA